MRTGQQSGRVEKRERGAVVAAGLIGAVASMVAQGRVFPIDKDTVGILSGGRRNFASALSAPSQGIQHSRGSGMLRLLQAMALALLAIFALAPFQAAFGQGSVTVTYNLGEVRRNDVVTATITIKNNTSSRIGELEVDALIPNVYPLDGTYDGSFPNCGVGRVGPGTQVTLIGLKSMPLEPGQYCSNIANFRINDIAAIGSHKTTLISSTQPVEFSGETIRILPGLPVIAAISPAFGIPAGGYAVTITGRNFVAGDTSVQFGSAAATNVSVQNSTTLTATVPAGATGTVPVRVTVGSEQSAPVDFKYALATTTLSLTSMHNPSRFGDVVVLTTTLSGAVSNRGTVELFQGSQSLGAKQTLGNIVTWHVYDLPLGQHSFTAVFSGDGDNAPSSSAPLVQTVERRVTLPVLSSSPNPSTVNQGVTLLAYLYGGMSPGGTVEFFSGNQSLGSAPLLGDLASLAVSSLAVGTHEFTATYSGDVNNLPSTSIRHAHTVDRATSQVALTASPDPTTVGQEVTLTATVVGASPSGRVEFFSGSQPIGTNSLSGGRARQMVSFLVAGSYNIRAVYSGDGDNQPSTSPIVTHSVEQAAPRLSLASSPNPSSPDQQLTLTATLAGDINALGDVEFFDGPSSLGRAALSGVTGSVSGRWATLIVTPLSAGSHSLRAEYVGNASNMPATSPTITHTVNRAAASMSLVVAPNPSTYGEDVTLTASVQGTRPTGEVRVRQNGSVIMTFPLSPDGTAVAIMPGPSLEVGTKRFQMEFLGDQNNSSAMSPEVIHEVRPSSTTLLLTSSGNVTSFGEAIALTATLSGAVNPTGRVEFLDGSASLGVVPLSGGSASLETSDLPAGAHLITARYFGDTNNGDALADPLVQIVSSISTSLSLASSANPAVAGDSVTFIASVAPATIAGEIVFSVDGVDQPPALLASGVARFDTRFPIEGDYTVKARYPGDANHAAAEAQPLLQSVLGADATVAVISDFLSSRADLILAHRPDAARRFARLDGTVPQPGAAGAAVMGYLPYLAEGAALPVSASLAAIDGLAGHGALQDFDVWFEGSFALLDRAGPDGRFSIATIGLDYLVTPDLLVGVLLQGDDLDQTARGGAGVEGSGWLIGPYATARLDENVYLDLFGGAGRSVNSVSPDGSSSDSFDATRWLFSAALEGQWREGPWSFSPRASLSYWQETSASYVDHSGVLIPSVTAGLGQFAIGPAIGHTLPLAEETELTLGLRLDGLANFGSAGAEDFAARTQASVGVQLPGGANLGLAATHSGAGSGSTSTGLSVTLGGQF